jgi:molybdopterin/thiamine biosynthesis adenylyltransferase
MTLTPEQRIRYSRMIALYDFSERDQEALLGSTVAVVGAGGLGSPVLRLLTAMGIGSIRIIDRDVVELSNIQRQTLYNSRDIGKAKADVAAENLALMNPDVTLEPLCVSLDENNANHLLKGVNVIVDGLDSFESRRAVNRASQVLNIPYIFAGALEYHSNITTFVPGKTGCLQCLLGDAVDSETRTCANMGVSPELLSIAASIEVREAVLYLTGRIPNLAGRLMVVDLNSLDFDIYTSARNPECPVCSNPGIKALQISDEIMVTPLCSGLFNVHAVQNEALDLKQLAAGLSSEYTMRWSGRSLVISIPTGEKITLMRSGNAVIDGCKSKEEASALYQRFLSMFR